MNRRTVIVSAALMSLAALAAAPMLAPMKAPPRPKKLVGAMEPFNYLLGSWEIHGTWVDGRPINAHNDYRVGVAGKFLEINTTATDDEGKPYERYLTVFTHDDSTGTYTSHNFTFDGTSHAAEFQVNTSGEAPLFSSEWSVEDANLKQSLTPIDDDSYAWKVWVQPGGQGDWQPMMDGVWRRVH
ncbi:MAG: hypothetical protein R3B57_08320 [Phycisphaerales bacterium]